MPEIRYINYIATIVNTIVIKNKYFVICFPLYIYDIENGNFFFYISIKYKYTVCYCTYSSEKLLSFYSKTKIHVLQTIYYTNTNIIVWLTLCLL